MTVDSICKRVGISRRHWNYLISGERNAGLKTAKALARVLGADKTLFVFGTAKQRQSAWTKAQRSVR